MKKNYIHKSKYFYGHEISDYGLENGYIDYCTLSKAFDMVLNNNIISATGWENWEQDNGFIDNSERLEEIENELYTLYNEAPIKDNETDTPEYKFYSARIEELEEEKEELEQEQDYFPEIYQYYIISDNGARIIEELTDEIVFYNSELDMYIWGVTHWGTSWDYVLTDIKIELENEEK